MNRELKGDNDAIRLAGRRADELREQHNETQRYLAGIVGVSPSYMSRLLRDMDEWSKEQAQRVAEHYKVSFDYIYYGITLSEKREQQIPEMDFATQSNDMIMRLKKMPVNERQIHAKRILVDLVGVMVEE